MNSNQKKIMRKLCTDIYYNLRDDAIKYDKRVKKISSGKVKYAINQTLKQRGAIIDLLAKYQSSGKVLDIGIGYGYNAFSLKELYSHEVCAIEHPGPWVIKNPYFKLMCKKYNIRLSLCDMTNEDFPYESKFFDAVLFAEVLEHINPFYRKKNIG